MSPFMRAACVLLLSLTGGCAGVHIPNKRVGALPGPLESAYTPGPSQAGKPDTLCHAEKVSTAVTEIAIERTACYGFCPMYTLTLHSDGTVFYTGRGNVRLLGEHKGWIHPVIFSRLAALAEELGVTDKFEVQYDCAVTDSPTVFLSTVKAGQRRIIKHYAPNSSGPVALWWFEQLLDESIDRVEWN